MTTAVGMHVRQCLVIRHVSGSKNPKSYIVDVTLTMSRGIEVHPVNDAFESRVRLRNVVQAGGKALADLAGEFSDDGYGSVSSRRLIS